MLRTSKLYILFYLSIIALGYDVKKIFFAVVDVHATCLQY